MRDLAPSIYRQRLMIEGVYTIPVDADTIRGYLIGLSDVCDMSMLNDPVVDWSPAGRWAGWVHWDASGAQVHAWVSPVRFFSADVYTCKSFDVATVAAYTGKLFDAAQFVARSY